MNALVAAVARGVPPMGLGAYTRASAQTDFPWRFRALQAFVAGAQTRVPSLARQVDDARSAGGGIWVYGGPEHFTPDNWQSGVDVLERAVDEFGLAGLIVDVEEQWSGSTSQAARTRGFEQLGARLAIVSRKTRVGLTYIPLLPSLETLVEASGDGVWGTPQIYGRTTNDPGVFASWWKRTTDLFGTRCIPSIAGWNGNPAQHGTAELYKRYLAALPKAQGAIAWTTGTPDGHIAAALRTWTPAEDNAQAILLAGRAFVMRPAFILVAFVVLAALVALGAL